MKIEIIAKNINDVNGVHLSRIAWYNSRSWDDKTKLEDILCIDAPVNDFPSFVLNIESSIMVREVIASMRGHVMWARTSRVDEPIDFDIEDCGITNSENLEVESLRNEMMYLKNSETRQDEYRLLMPVIGITRYTIRISLRSAIKLCHYFNKLKTELTGIPSVIFGEAANKFIQFLHDSFPAHADLTKVVSSYRTVDIVPALKENEMQSGQVGDFIVISVVIPFSLRTHLIRHNSLHIKDNLIEFFDDEDIHKKTINDKMNVQISASRSFWTHVLKERSCWMSHYGMWKQIMSELSNIVMQNETFLPCGGVR